jgi:hypothetical protein
VWAGTCSLTHAALHNERKHLRDGHSEESALDAGELNEFFNLGACRIHEHVEELSVCAAHAVWVHDLVAPADLEDVLEELRILLEVPVLHKRLAAPVVLQPSEDVDVWLTLLHVMFDSYPFRR